MVFASLGFIIFLGLGIPKVIFASDFDWSSLLIFLGPLGMATWLFKDKIGDAGQGVLEGVLATLGEILAKLAIHPLEWANSLLQWVTSKNFISFSFTGADNWVVQTGWTMVRDFTNMFIILGFVIVALATILRIKEYQAQKLLPILIGIALLINFTPVICGFFIDISNVTMNHFLTEGAVPVNSMIDEMNEGIEKIRNDDEAELPAKVISFLLIAMFGLVGAIILALLAFLFIFRYIILWILIILSPIAFFCYVLPFTKKYFSQWWNIFFQWCIIGIPAAFFIYLSRELMLAISGESAKITGDLTNAPTGSAGGFGNLFVYIIPLAFLIAGLYVSLHTGAAGASAIMSSSNRVARRAGRVGKWAGGKIGETAPAKWVKETGRRRITEPLRPRIPFSKRGKIAAKAKYQESKEKDIATEMTRLEHMSVEDRKKFVKTPIEKLAAFRLAVKEGHLDDWDEKNIKIVKGYGTQKDLVDAEKKRSDLVAKLQPEKVDKVMKEKPGISRAEAEAEVIRVKIQGKQPVKLRQETQAKAFEDGDVLLAVIEDERQFEEMKGRGSMEQKKAMRKGLHSKKAKEALKKKLAILAEEAERGIKKSAEEEERLLKRTIEIEEGPEFA